MLLCQVFYGIPFKPGDVILTSVAEYGSNYLAYLQVSQRMQATARQRQQQAATHSSSGGSRRGNMTGARVCTHNLCFCLWGMRIVAICLCACMLVLLCCANGQLS
jgi:hypothetical protein